MFAKILSFFGLSSCATPPSDNGPGARSPEKKELAVLFIGNSYSFDVPTAFKKIARSNGRKVKVGRSTFGGWTLGQHTVHEPTLEKLRAGNWDFVVIQEHSLHPGSPEAERKEVMDPRVKILAEEARATGATPLLYQTWGRRDGDERIPGDDFYAMNERVRNGCRKASEHAGGVTIVPAGDAWEREFRAGRGHDLYQEDGSHPSAYGNQVTARVFYETIFRE